MRNRISKGENHTTLRMVLLLTVAQAIALVLTAGIARTSQVQSGPLPSFDVASVKPYKPIDSETLNSRWSVNPGKLIAIDVRLADVIERAYGVKNYQLSGPSWLGSERYIIQAMWPPSTPDEQLPLMLQTFLQQRFKLTFHRDTKLFSVYELQIARGGPKMQAGSPNGRASFKGGRGHFYARSIPIARLAETLSNQIGRPVLDRTGLTGTFTFELQFTPEIRSSSGLPTDNGVVEMAGPSIFTSVTDQFGLKLFPRRDPLEILVIDSAEKVPNDN
jgi:uncharacterized protein (TIGR03435 family)